MIVFSGDGIGMEMVVVGFFHVRGGQGKRTFELPGEIYKEDANSVKAGVDRGPFF